MTPNALSLAQEKIAEFLTAPYGQRWYAVEDVNGWHLESCSSGCHLVAGERTLHLVLVAKSPGVANQDSSYWTEGLYEDEEGGWVDGETSTHLGRLEDVIEWCCRNGDVTGPIEDFEKKIAEALRAEGVVL